MVLLFVPHEDDEINVAGATVYGLKQAGYRVIVAYSTNGDRSYTAETRIGEAADSLKKLGVPFEDMVILGYPDGNGDASRSPYVHGVDGPLSVDGHKETYGIQGKQDFSMIVHGRHTPYTRAGFMENVEMLLRTYRPDSIIGIDFDTHPDHRACSIALETALGHILNEKGNTWFPLVLKEFAYNTGFESVADFYAPHLYSTKFNQQRLLKRLQEPSYETDNPPYRWDDRLRLPVMAACRVPLLQKNVIYHALRYHISQRAILKAEQIINSDQVFWLRRVDNLAFRGVTTVSSGNGDCLHDFKMIDSGDISVERPVFDAVLWEPDASDKEKTARITFDHPQHVAQLVLYGNVEKESHVMDVLVTFSSGYTVKTGPLPENGQPFSISMEPQDDVKWIKCQLLKTSGPHAGLTEWEIFAHKDPGLHLLKILVDGNFAYDWDVYPGEKPQISVYSTGAIVSLQWSLNGKEMDLAALQERLASFTGTAVIRVSAGGSLYDEITLRRKTAGDLKKLKRQQRWDRFLIWWDNFKIKRKHHQLRKLKRDSLRQLQTGKKERKN